MGLRCVREDDNTSTRAASLPIQFSIRNDPAYTLDSFRYMRDELKDVSTSSSVSPSSCNRSIRAHFRRRTAIMLKAVHPRDSC